MTKDYVNTLGSECYAVARHLGGQWRSMFELQNALHYSCIAALRSWQARYITR